MCAEHLRHARDYVRARAAKASGKKPSVPAVQRKPSLSTKVVSAAVVHLTDVLETTITRLRDDLAALERAQEILARERSQETREDQ